MSLIKSISGFRGTIGGAAGDNLTPEDIVQSVAAYGTWLLQSGAPARVVIGRDARPSGDVVTRLTSATLQMLGITVIDLGLATTPTVEMAVTKLEAGGGIILSASHNPVHWNALKLLNHKGEFISAADGESLLQLLADGGVTYAEVSDLGDYQTYAGALQDHIQAVLDHPLVNVAAVKKAGFKVVVDPVNSVGAIALPALLEALGCGYTLLHGEMNGRFAHEAEPLPHNLTDLIAAMSAGDADLGVAVDPDVDRLALVGPGGRWIGEEYTLVTVADYVLRHTPGPVVSNLSSTRALADLAETYGQPHHAAAVGEVNVVAKMKEVNAVIGGEGNGGIIDPKLHYGRDSLIGLALVLSHLATQDKNINQLRDGYPPYEMVKDKIDLTPGLAVDERIDALERHFTSATPNRTDGLKLDFADGWVHLRKSNTEPIVRVYAEAATAARARELAGEVKDYFLR
ncbi:MAG: phosphoglucosamine mutase [Saprospiraceae bacterium]